MVRSPDESHNLYVRFALSPNLWSLPKWITRPLGWDLRLVVLRIRFRRAT
jgi:hypothetical protein